MADEREPFDWHQYGVDQLKIADDRVRDVARSWWSSDPKHAMTDKQRAQILHDVMGNHVNVMMVLNHLEKG